MRRAAWPAMLAAVLVFASPAEAKSYRLTAAVVHANVVADGSIDVVETIAFEFHGEFHGADRTIPIGPGEQIDRISVDGYRPGGSAAHGSTGPADTFAVARDAANVRIVWHFLAGNEVRTFTLRYRLRRAAIAYDDVVDVDLNVWGSGWDVSLGRLDASLAPPRPADAASYRAWVHPVWAMARVQRAPAHVTLHAEQIHAHEQIGLRVVFPRRLLADTAGVVVRPGLGLPAIAAAERHALEKYRRDREQSDWVEERLAWLVPLFLLLGTGPAAAVILLVYRGFGRERPTAAAGGLEGGPPTDTPPALVSALLRQSTTVGTRELLATILDLIRRGCFAARPMSDDRGDLEISQGQECVLAAFETPVADLVDDVIADGPVPLRAFPSRLRECSGAGAVRYADFRAYIRDETRSRAWFVDRGRLVVAPLAVGLLVPGCIVFLVGAEALSGPDPASGGWLLAGIGGAAGLNGLLLLVTWLARPSIWRRRTAEAEAEAERWEAYLRYLDVGLPERPTLHAPSAEAALVYAVALGLGGRVIERIRLAAPRGYGAFGGAATGWDFDDLDRSFSGAISTGGGSAAGGGGSGGGGGSAW